MGYKVFIVIISVIAILLLVMESITFTNHGIVITMPYGWDKIESFLASRNLYTYFYFGLTISFIGSLLWFFGNGD